MAHYLTFLLCVVQISNTINNFIHLSFFQKKFTVESTLKQANPPAPRPTPPPWNLVRMGLGLAILIAETGNRVLLRRGVGIPSRYHLEECKGQNPPGKIPWRGGGRLASTCQDGRTQGFISVLNFRHFELVFHFFNPQTFALEQYHFTWLLQRLFWSEIWEEELCNKLRVRNGK